MAERPQPLPRKFFERPVLQVARSLLGCLLVRQRRGTLLVGRILETEAYAGHLDPASHSYRGQTERCKTMFGPRGMSYVYFTYGNHHCCNVTAGTGDVASAVLIRAVQPIEGHATMRRLRAASTSSVRRAEELASGAIDHALCDGPGKLAAAFDIDLRHDGQDVTRAEGLWMAEGERIRQAHWTPRIGLGKNPAAPWLWRCVTSRMKGVSCVPKTWPRAARAAPRLGELRRG